MPPNTGPIDYRRRCALSWDGAVIFPASLTVAIDFLFCCSSAQNFSVMLVNIVFQVGHASVTNFDCVLVQYFTEGVILGKILSYNRKEFLSNLSFQSSRPGWVPPRNSPASVPL